jgi:hypothetical protein
MASPPRAQPNRRERINLGFLRHVHRLLALGYEQLDAASYEHEEEEAITGDLVGAMNDVVEQTDAPSWTSHLAVCENVPQNVGGHKGKRRPRIDIEILRAESGKRHRFGFEAKRLHDRSDSVSVYLGVEGLGCFLSGQYAVEQAQAGMLGYVQAREPAAWLERISRKLGAERETHRLLGSECCTRRTLCGTLECTFETRHQRDRNSAPLSIFHTLLCFHGRQG